MAKLGCGPLLQQQLLYPRWRMMSTMGGLGCQGMQQPRGYSLASMLQPRSAEILGQRTKFRVLRRTSLLANPKAGQDFDSATSSAALADSSAEISGRREGGVSVAFQGDVAAKENLWRCDLESLIHGHVGRFAFLAILLLGVGVGCLTSVGDAQAAVSHISNGNGGPDMDMRSLALGPEGPLLEEFWDNMRRYGLYFVTVVTGGIYQLVKPAIDALQNPVTAVLIIVIVTGSIYLVGLTVSAMLGINEFQYDYAI